MNAAGMRNSAVEIQSNYKKKFDIQTTDANAIFIGYAAMGSATSSAVWQIRKFTLSSGDPITMEWADGNEAFDNVWDDIATLSYS